MSKINLDEFSETMRHRMRSFRYAYKEGMGTDPVNFRQNLTLDDWWDAFVDFLDHEEAEEAGDKVKPVAKDSVGNPEIPLDA